MTIRFICDFSRSFELFAIFRRLHLICFFDRIISTGAKNWSFALNSYQPGSECGVAMEICVDYFSKRMDILRFVFVFFCVNCLTFDLLNVIDKLKLLSRISI